MKRTRVKIARRKKKTHKVRIPRVLRELAPHKGKILVGILTIVIAGLSWHLNNCLTDKKERVRELRQAFASFRAADEKFDQDMFTLYSNVNFFIKYLNQDNPDLALIEQYKNQAIALAKAGNDDCNNVKNAFYKFVASKEATETYYQLPNFGYKMDISHKCAGVSAIAGGVGWPDVSTLGDKILRNKFIEEQRPFQKEIDDILRIGMPENRKQTDFFETLLKKMEARNSNLIASIWDCLILPFTTKKTTAN